MSKSKTIDAAVIGAGAIGSILAAMLQRAGFSVEVVSKPASAAKLAARKGIRVDGVAVGKPFTARLKVFAKASQLTHGPDVVFLATKARHVVKAARQVLRKLRKDTAVVVMQNGFCEEAVSEVVGAERVVGCAVAWGATAFSPVHSRKTTHGGFIVGRLDGTISKCLMTAAKLLHACAPVKVTSNIVGVRYTKLALNCCLTTIGAVSGLTVRGILSTRCGREHFLRTATEIIDVLLASGIRLEPIHGFRMTWLRIDPRKFDRQLSLERALKEVVLRVFSLLRGSVVSSSLQSLMRGEPTEIDYLNAHIVRMARKAGVPVPVNECLVRMVKEIERGERRIDPRNLEVGTAAGRNSEQQPAVGK